MQRRHSLFAKSVRLTVAKSENQGPDPISSGEPTKEAEANEVRSLRTPFE